MLFDILIIVLITAVKALFSASDTAFTYLNKAEINQLSKRNKKAKKIKYLMEDGSKFFGIIEVGINMAELIASSYASVTILYTLTDGIQRTGLAYNVSMFIAAFIITIALAYVLLLFGGVLPKRYARNNPRKVAFTLIDFLWIMSKLNYPFEKLIYVSLKFFTKVFNLKAWPQERLTDKQIKMIITEGREEGLIASIEKKILFNALKLDNIQVRRIMIRKEDVDFVNINQSFNEILDNIDTFNFTRMPVYEDNINNVIGIFNIKDLIIDYAKDHKINKNLRQMIRKASFVGPEEKILDVFKKMQKENQMIAIVKNKKDEVLGIISLEDILEKIVGKISDEFDENREK